jgi:hypothetical protein
MRLVVFNGSGRGANSNSVRLLQSFLKGFQKSPGNQVEVVHLQKKYCDQELRDFYLSADRVLIISPLYVDGVTSQTKSFIESLSPLCPSEKVNRNPPIAFYIHACFPEPEAMQEMAHYSKRLCELLGTKWLGALVGGASEGVREITMVKILSIPYHRFLWKWGKYFGIHGDLKCTINTFVPYPPRGHKFYLKMFMWGDKTLYFRPRFKKNRLSKEQIDAQPFKAIF